MLGPTFPANAADLTVNQLQNCPYFIPSWENPAQGEWVPVRIGEFNRKNRDNPLFLKVVEIALGHLANRPARNAAVVYGYNIGGSGFFLMLAAAVNDRGKPKFLAFTDLGDRVKINSLRIEAGKIVLDLVVHGPDDPSCCPTVRKIATYTLAGHKLVEQ